jgi:hypothetical protein
VSQVIRFQRQWLTVLIVVITFFSQASLLRAQTKPVDEGKADSSQAIQTFPEPEPQADESAIDEHKKVLRAEIAVDSSTTVRFYEEPTSVTVYDSSISIERGSTSIASYKIGRMINHQPLRLVHAALIRSGDSGMLICEYEGGAVGAREGFAILRFSPAGFELHTLLLTDFGKVVVFRRDPARAEIWSALDENAGSVADERFYMTRACRWQSKGYTCAPPRKKAGRFAPGAIDDPGIEIRP